MNSLRGRHLLGILGLVIFILVALKGFLKEEMQAYPQKPKVVVAEMVASREVEVPRLKEKPLWEISVYKSASKPKVENTLNALIEMGLPVYIEEVALQDKPFYSLKAGPFLTKKEANEVLAKLKSQHLEVELKQTVL